MFLCFKCGSGNIYWLHHQCHSWSERLELASITNLTCQWSMNSQRGLWSGKPDHHGDVDDTNLMIQFIKHSIIPGGEVFEARFSPWGLAAAKSSSLKFLKATEAGSSHHGNRGDHMVSGLVLSNLQTPDLALLLVRTAGWPTATLTTCSRRGFTAESWELCVCVCLILQQQRADTDNFTVMLWGEIIFDVARRWNNQPHSDNKNKH